MWKSTSVKLTSGAAVMVVLALLWGAGPVMPQVLVAALLHELGHLLILCCYRVPVESIIIMPMGALIVAPQQERLSYGGELTAALAGIFVNITLAFFSARVMGDYLFAGANLLLGLYNLLPIQGLDGGRALYLLLAYCSDPFTAQRIAGIVNLVTLAILGALSLALFYHADGGFYCLAGVLGMTISQIRVAKGRKKR